MKHITRFTALCFAFAMILMGCGKSKEDSQLQVHRLTFGSNTEEEQSSGTQVTQAPQEEQSEYEDEDPFSHDNLIKSAKEHDCMALVGFVTYVGGPFDSFESLYGDSPMIDLYPFICDVDYEHLADYGGPNSQLYYIEPVDENASITVSAVQLWDGKIISRLYSSSKGEAVLVNCNAGHNEGDVMVEITDSAGSYMCFFPCVDTDHLGENGYYVLQPNGGAFYDISMGIEDPGRINEADYYPEDIYGEWEYNSTIDESGEFVADGSRMQYLVVSESDGHVAVEVTLDDGDFGGSYYEYDGLMDGIEDYVNYYEGSPEWAYEIQGADYRYNRHYVYLAAKNTLLWVDAFYPEEWCQGEPYYVTHYYSKR